MMDNLLKVLMRNRNLSFEEAGMFVDALLAGDMPEALAGGILSALAYKGETGDELSGFVNSLLKSSGRIMERPFEDVFDCCGTGGSGTHKLNVSSAVGVLCAYFGVKVAKHGNRSATSRSGSADVFERMGFPLTLDNDALLRLLSEKNFAFLFAPAFFPAMKNAVPVRKALGIRTAFNMAGPLSNPMSANIQLIGVSSMPDMERIASAVLKLGKKRVLIVHSEEGFDEISPLEKTHAILVEGNNKKSFIINPNEFAVDSFDSDELIGKDVDYNAQMMLDLFNGKGLKGYKAAVAINSAYALWINGRVRSAEDAFDMAMDILDTDKLLVFWNDILGLVQ